MSSEHNISKFEPVIWDSEEQHRRADNDMVLWQGLGVLLMSGVHFNRTAEGLGTRREARLLRDAARGYGLRQFSRTIRSGDSVALLVQWYRETPGDALWDDPRIPDGWSAYCVENVLEWAASRGLTAV